MSNTKGAAGKETAVSQSKAKKPARPVTQAAVSPHVPVEQLLQRASHAPRALAPNDIAQLQRSVGNRALTHLIPSQSKTPNLKSSIVIRQSPILQPKLTVNDPNDQYEQEADAVADAVMRLPVSSPPPAADDVLAETAVQRKGEDVPPVTLETESRIHTMRGGGSPLPTHTQHFFESRLGADLSGVRVHTDGNAVQAARDVQARAFTTGSDIAFNEGEYQPGTEDGRKLLAHELTHTIQQGAVARRQPLTIQRRKSPTEPADLENAPEPTESDIAAAEAAASHAATEAEAEKGISEGEQAAKLAESEAEKQKGEAAKGQIEGAKSATVEKTAVPSQPTNQPETAELEGETAENAGGLDGKVGVGESPPADGEEGGEATGSGVGLEGAAAAAQERLNQALAEAENAPDKAPASPEEDGGLTNAKQAGAAVAKRQQAHPNAQDEAAAAQMAAEQPPAEVAGLAQANQVSDMEQTETPAFDKAAFKEALLKRIEATAPKNAEEADTFKEEGKLDGIKDDVRGEVGQQQEEARGPLDETRQAEPDTGRVPPKTTQPLAANQPGAPPTAIGAQNAVPKPKGQGELEKPLHEGSKSLDQQIADAEMTEEQLENSNEPTFVAALEGKRAAQEAVKAAPTSYREEEQAHLKTAEQEAVATAQAQLQGMHGDRSALLAEADGEQMQAKGADEQKRAEVAAEINAIYAETQQEVEGILGGLDAKVTAEFDAGATRAMQTFEDYVERKMDAYKEERYGGVLGWGRWLADLGKLPPAVNRFYAQGRQLYMKRMDAVIDKVAAIVATTLTEAKAAVANGKQRIQEYVASLPQELQQVGQEAADAIQSQFATLEQSIEEKQGELVDTLAQKYQENLQAVDARIEKYKEDNKGILSKAGDMLGGVFTAVLEMRTMLLSVLSRVADAVSSIITDPIGFLGNLLEAVKQGFNQFVDNIDTHLKQGLIGWLTGTIASAGITLPETFDLKGIFELVMQILGISFEQIMGKLGNALGIDIMGILEPIKELIGIYQEEGFVGLAKFGLEKLIGEENMGHLMKVWELFQAVQEGGLGALWEQIQEYLGDLKEMVMGQIESFISTEVIKAGVTWLISLFNPASAFVKACKMIYDVVMFFVQRGSQIMSLVNAVIDSVGAIASGSLGAAANFIEQSLAKAIPVAISFLSSLLGLGDISGKVQEIIQKARTTIDGALDKLFNSKPVQAVASFISKGASKIKLLAANGFANTKGTLDIGVRKLKGRLGIANPATLSYAEELVAKATEKQFANEEDLQKEIKSIENQLLKKGLNFLRIKRIAKTNNYSILARSEAKKVGEGSVGSSSMSKITIYFDSENLDENEYKRQLSNQEEGLNKLTINQWEANRKEYFRRKELSKRKKGRDPQDDSAISGLREKLKEPLWEFLTEEFEEHFRQHVIAKHPEWNEELVDEEVEARIEDYVEDVLASINILHNADQVAGGVSIRIGYNRRKDFIQNKISEFEKKYILNDSQMADGYLDWFGHAEVNQSIGRQWPLKISKIIDAINQQSLSGTEVKLNVKLETEDQ